MPLTSGRPATPPATVTGTFTLPASAPTGSSGTPPIVPSTSTWVKRKPLQSGSRRRARASTDSPVSEVHP